MKSQKLITALFLMLPAAVWAQPAPQIPEPGILPLLAAAGVVGIAAKFMRRKK